MPISGDYVLWAYRVLLDRDPEFRDHDGRGQHYANVRALRAELIGSPEYAFKNGLLAPSSDGLRVYADMSPYGFQGVVYVNLADYIGLSVAKAVYEREEVEFVKANVRQGNTVIDIGANIGFFTVFCSHLVGPTGKVFSCEPVPSTLVYLKKSIAANSFCSNVILIEDIVSDRTSDDFEIAYQPLAEGSGSTGGSFLVKKGEPLAPHLSRKAITSAPLDSLIPEDQKIDFIKIDIEGAEPLAMKGAERILKTQSPLIMSEVHTNQLIVVSKMDWRGYFKLMDGYGYRPFFFSKGKVTSTVNELAEGGVYNVAFVKQ